MTAIRKREKGLFFLVGPRACGKTTLGLLLADRLTLPFKDTDACLQRELGEDIAQIVDTHGWAYFRKHESAVLHKTTGQLVNGGVIATGGGMVLMPENRVHMRSHGKVFFLSVPIDLLISRLEADPQDNLRPPLTASSVKDEVAQILAERDSLYRDTAHHVIDAALPPEEICQNIVDILKMAS